MTLDEYWPEYRTKEEDEDWLDYVDRKTDEARGK